MSDAPEKIWATKSMAGKLNYNHKSAMGEWATEYTRSDVAQARIDKLERALRDIKLYTEEDYALGRACAALKEADQ